MQSTLWKKVTVCNVDVYAASAWDACVFRIIAQLLYNNNLLIYNYIFLFLGLHGC